MPKRPWHCYRHFGTPPYTRKEYIRSIPPVQIPKFDHGNPKGKFGITLRLLVTKPGQISSNALEAARRIANRYLEKHVGPNNYYLRIAVYPHHIVRENKMMAIAGADRLQDGMRLAFGTPIGRAARVSAGQTVIMVQTSKQYLEFVKNSLSVASSKLPLPTRISIEEYDQETGDQNHSME